MPKPFMVTKVFEFCYGHRLSHYAGKCGHLHGHQAKVEIDIAKEKLDDKGLSYDFSEIKRAVQEWVDKELDHKMLLKETDPLVPVLKEMKEPVCLLKGNPSAENLARLFFEKTADLGFPVEEVRFWETPDAYATYRYG